MNFLFLVEGSKTEPKVYQSWLLHLFPNIEFVRNPEDMTSHSCRIIPGNGYPNMVSAPKSGGYPSRLEACLLDISYFKNVDYFFICVDSEEETPESRYQEVSSKLEMFKTKVGLDNYQSTEFHIIVQECCFETWALGNSEISNENQSKGASIDLKVFQEHYDVLTNDPQKMQNISQKKFPTKARFHAAYLEEYLKTFGLLYKKKKPVVIQDEKYLNALMKRCDSTDHLSSLKNLLDLWQEIRNRHY